ncbi:Glycerate dehydrogenase [bioreactor metagenome]|uniref:Glycerate dehydrogenase n=1 Tax=bioreactor metagenome TaxID=1076179 RepID=A0A645J6V5_9ZZZZ
MKVLVYTRTHKPPEGLEFDYVSLEELLQKSDIVSLHCPLTPETQGIISKNTIAMMKDGALLINTARGKAIVEQDVFDALESGKLGGAGVDVLSVEPPKDNVLFKAKNIFITPHMGWGTLASRQRLMAITEANLEAFVKGEPINVVNK